MQVACSVRVAVKKLQHGTIQDKLPLGRQSAGLDPTVWYCRLDGFLSSGSMPKPVLDVSIWYRSMQQI